MNVTSLVGRRRRHRGARRLTIVGDALLDHDVDGVAERLAPDAPVPVVDQHGVHPRPGGAGLAALLAARDGDAVTLITALGADDAGESLRALLEADGVCVIDLGSNASTSERIRIRASGRPVLRLDRGSRDVGRLGGFTQEAAAALARAEAILVADHGRGVTRDGRLRGAIARLASSTPVVWDPHLRGASPVPGTRLATPNRSEARHFARGVLGEGIDGAASMASRLVEAWRTEAVAVTLGAGGAVLVAGRSFPTVVPAPLTVDGDPCGAGDRFASRATSVLAGGGDVSAAVEEAVGATSHFVAAGGAGGLHVVGSAKGSARVQGSGLTAREVVGQTRARGGVVVATGGCFDLLHAGHIEMLRAARALGDCLIVCLSSDESVRRQKGPERPINAVVDREAVLLALAAVDAVVVFDEDTPCRVLAELKPDLWVQGGDSQGVDVPEAGIVAAAGGRMLVVPSLENRSTSRLLQEVARRACS